MLAVCACVKLGFDLYELVEEWNQESADALSVQERFAVPLRHWNDKSYLSEGAVPPPLPPPSFLSEADRASLTAELPPSTQLMQLQSVEALDSQRALGMTLPTEVRSLAELVSLMQSRPLGSVADLPVWPEGVVPAEVVLTLLTGRTTMMQWDVELLLDFTAGWSARDAARLEFARGKVEEVAAQSVLSLGVYQSLPVLSEEHHLKSWHMFNALTESLVRLGKRDELSAAADAFTLAVEQHIALSDGPHAPRAKLLRAAAKERIGERLGRAAASVGDYSRAVAAFRSAMQGYLEFERGNVDPLASLNHRSAVQWDLWVHAMRSAELTPTRIMLALAHAASKDPTAGRGVALAYALAAHEAIDGSRGASAASSVQIVRDVLEMPHNSNLSPAASTALHTNLQSLLSADRCAQLVLAASDRRDASTVGSSQDLLSQAAALSDQVLDRHCNADAAATSMLIARLLKEQNAAQYAAEIDRLTDLAQQLAAMKAPAKS